MCNPCVRSRNAAVCSLKKTFCLFMTGCVKFGKTSVFCFYMLDCVYFQAECFAPELFSCLFLCSRLSSSENASVSWGF